VIAQQIHDQTVGLGDEVEFLALLDNGPLSTGAKLRTLYSMCSGRYICGVGDDDSVVHDYVSSLLSAVKAHDVDLVTFDHTYSVDGTLFALTRQVPGGPEQKIPGTDAAGLETHVRLPGPLCPVRAEIVRAFTVPDASDREDCAYKEYLKTATSTHHGIERVLYHHQWVSHNKRERDGLRETWRRG
jgi:hypothetical protein